MLARLVRLYVLAAPGVVGREIPRHGVGPVPSKVEAKLWLPSREGDEMGNLIRVLVAVATIAAVVLVSSAIAGADGRNGHQLKPAKQERSRMTAAPGTTAPKPASTVVTTSSAGVPDSGAANADDETTEVALEQSEDVEQPEDAEQPEASNNDTVEEHEADTEHQAGPDDHVDEDDQGGQQVEEDEDDAANESAENADDDQGQVDQGRQGDENDQGEDSNNGD